MEKKELKIELDPEVADGVFSNMVIISHTEGEFFLDFVFVPPQQDKAKIRSRVIMSPVQTKRFFKAFQENIKLFEQKYGQINTEAHDLSPRYLT